MKINRFTYEPTALVSMSEKDIAILLACAERHYDHRVKSAAKAGIGGTFWGWRNQISSRCPASLPEGEIRCSGRDVDLAIKALEISAKSKESGEELDARINLAYDLIDTFSLLNEEWSRLNESEEEHTKYMRLGDEKRRIAKLTFNSNMMR